MSQQPSLTEHSKKDQQIQALWLDQIKLSTIKHKLRPECPSLSMGPWAVTENDLEH